MRKFFIGASALAFIGLAAIPTAFAQSVAEQNKTLDSLFGEHDRYRSFLQKLKKAVAAGDKAAVAGMVSYPFQTKVGGKTLKVRNAAAFAKNYNAIVTAKIKQAVAKQNYETLFANAEGLMIGDGEVWFSGIGAGAKPAIQITAINN